MNDRYLFRAKRTDNGEWVEGALFDGKEHCIIGQKIKFSPYVSIECKIIGYEVDPSTICQCTGLKDKNGRLIWENDMLVAHLDDEFPEDATYAQVIWRNSSLCLKHSGCDFCEQLDEFVKKHFEVIGSVIDNPELLEVGE